jgi:hypothetical protein
MRQRLIQVKKQQLINTKVLLLKVKVDLPAADLLIVDLLHVLKEMNRLQYVNGEFADHVTLQLAVLLGNVILNLLLGNVVLHHAPVPLPVFLLAVFCFKVTENYLLIRHRRRVSVDKFFEFVFAGLLLVLAAVTISDPIIVLITLALVTLLQRSSTLSPLL